MLNMLRSDFYRLWKSGALVAFPIAAAIVFALFGTAEIMDGAWSGRAGSGDLYDPTFVGLAGAVGFGNVFLLPLVSCGWMVWLLDSDIKTGALKTVFVTSRARAHYIVAALIICCAGAVVATAILLAVCAWLPADGTIEVAPADAGLVAQWAVLAALVCVCFGSIALGIYLLCGGSRAAWIVVILLCCGVLGKVSMAVLALATVAGGGEEVLELATLLPSASAYVLKGGLRYLAVDGVMFKVAFYPVFWITVSSIAAYARMRRFVV